jgi:hypothetical protein
LELVHRFGEVGRHFCRIVRGLDERGAVGASAKDMLQRGRPKAVQAS